MVLFRNKSIGFTLIELMVVISILAILVAIGVTSYSTIRKNSRDSIRKSDLHSIQNALEQYYGKNETYTTISTLSDAGYFPKGVPTDPKNDCEYEGISSLTTSSASYNICAYLEGSTNDYCKYCDPDNCSPLPNLTECVTNLQ